MNRILTALILLLVAGVAFADDIGTAKTFASGLTPSSTDYSVAYLSQIFGTVGNVLVGTSGQVIGKMFAIFNKGVLVAAALWLCMTTVQMCLRAATEGSFMGQNKSAHMIMLRIALGFGLIIPSSATGYSLLQDIFMKVVVSSVALADQTWSAALNYIEYGGQLFIPPATLPNDPNVINNMIGTGKLSSKTIPPRNLGLTPATQIFQNLVCMVQSSSKAWASIDANGNPIRADYRPQYNYTAGQINFPGVGDSASNPNAKGCGSATSYFCANNLLCLANETRNSVQNAEFDYSYSALKQLVDALLPVAQNYVQQQKEANATPAPTQTEIDANSKINAKGILVGILGYGNLITPYQNLISKKNQLTDSDKLETAKAQGWIMAGAFYWNVEQDNNISSGVAIGKLLPTVSTPTSIVYSKDPAYLAGAANAVTQTYASYIATLWQHYVGAQQNDITKSSGKPASESGGLTSQLIGNAVGKMVNANFSPTEGGNYNPIVTLMSEGNNLLQVVVTIWITTITISSIVAIGAGFCNSTSPGGLIFKTIMSWMKSILMIVTGALLVPGAILAYYVPMYPFAVFTFAAIGWFGMILEGMAAAPLVCLGMTHPEGHDFLGKAEQASMLLLNIFLRPTLMVIGVIAFMVVSFVAFEMLIAGYGTLLSGLSNTGTNDAFSGDGLLMLITKTMVLVIFGFMTMELIEQCAKLIYQIPNNINRWIGAPGMGEEYGQMAGAIKGGVSGAAEQGGRGAQLGLESGESAGQIGGLTYKGSEEGFKEGESKGATGSVKPTK